MYAAITMSNNPMVIRWRLKMADEISGYLARLRVLTIRYTFCQTSATHVGTLWFNTSNLSASALWSVKDDRIYHCDLKRRFIFVQEMATASGLAGPADGSILSHWGRDRMAAISETTVSSAFSWMKTFEFQIKFHWSFFLKGQLTIFQHWFR